LAWLLAFDKLRAKAPLENIFPGYDPLMPTDFPAVAEDITQLAWEGCSKTGGEDYPACILFPRPSVCGAGMAPHVPYH
jgi:hypothetical protein